MAGTERALRVVQWTTGKVARQSIKVLLDRPGLELVGVYAHSREKVGQDAGELAGLGRKLGVAATGDIDALIALKPDCVVYMPLHPDVEHMARLLRSGINIATNASFLNGRAYGEQARRKLEDAAQTGKASLFGSGINPGWIDNLAATACGLCKEVHGIRIVESFNIGLWAGDANQDALGWGRPAGDPSHAADVERATMPFGDVVETVAGMFEFELDDVRCEVEFAHATADLDVPGRTIKKGTVAGIMAQWFGVSAGLPVIEATVQWTVGDDITPAWKIDMAHRIEIDGTPQLKLHVEVMPEDLTLPVEELMTMGSLFAATPVVNAIPAVVAARPGIVTYADLPPITSVLRPKPRKRPSVTALVETAQPATHTPSATAAPESVEGRWNVVVKGPTGPQATELIIERKDGKLTGVQTGQGVSSPIVEMSVVGNNVRWVNHVTRPMKLKVEFSGVVHGATMHGQCKAGFMGRYPFTASRAT